MDPRSIAFVGATGLGIAGDIYGDAHSETVLLLHGGGQTRHAWGDAGSALAAAGFQAIALDLRGHGESAWASDGDYSLEAFAADLRAVMVAIGKPVSLVGASLGGLTSLIVAGTQRDAAASNVRALVLVDITPRMAPEGVQRIVGFMSAHPEGFATIEAAADAISEYMPHRRRPKDLSGLSKNLVRGDDGRYRWHWDPKFLQWDRRPHATRGPEPLLNAARALTAPVLLVRGKLSDLVTPEAVAEFRAAVPHAEFVDVADAAHMVAGDKNDAFTRAVVAFLVRLRDRAPSV